MIEKTEFKGKPVLVLKKTEEDKRVFSFGLYKAKLILEHISQIQDFVAENERKTE